jgi:hypothetical protein
MGNIPFTDERFPIKVVDGNFIRDEFNAYKDTGKLAANMHRAPVLIVGDAVIGQSKSIERYLAKRANFFGNNATEEALIDMLAEHIRDIKEVRLLGLKMVSRCSLGPTNSFSLSPPLACCRRRTARCGTCPTARRRRRRWPRGSTRTSASGW